MPDAHPRIHCGPEVPFFGDFYGNYLGDALHHLRFTRAARSLFSEDELLEILGARICRRPRARGESCRKAAVG